MKEKRISGQPDDPKLS